MFRTILKQELHQIPAKKEKDEVWQQKWRRKRNKIRCFSAYKSNLTVQQVPKHTKYISKFLANCHYVIGKVEISSCKSMSYNTSCLVQLEVGTREFRAGEEWL